MKPYGGLVFCSRSRTIIYIQIIYIGAFCQTMVINTGVLMGNPTVPPEHHI